MTAIRRFFDRIPRKLRIAVDLALTLALLLACYVAAGCPAFRPSVGRLNSSTMLYSRSASSGSSSNMFLGSENVLFSMAARTAMKRPGDGYFVERNILSRSKSPAFTRS